MPLKSFLRFYWIRSIDIEPWKPRKTLKKKFSYNLVKRDFYQHWWSIEQRYELNPEFPDAHNSKIIYTNAKWHKFSIVMVETENENMRILLLINQSSLVIYRYSTCVSYFFHLYKIRRIVILWTKYISMFEDSLSSTIVKRPFPSNITLLGGNSTI